MREWRWHPRYRVTLSLHTVCPVAASTLHGGTEYHGRGEDGQRRPHQKSTSTGNKPLLIDANNGSASTSLYVNIRESKGRELGQTPKEKNDSDSYIMNTTRKFGTTAFTIPNQSFLLLLLSHSFPSFPPLIRFRPLLY